MVPLDDWTDFLGDPHQVETELRSALTGAAKRLLPDVEVRTSKEWGMMATQHAPKVESMVVEIPDYTLRKNQDKTVSEEPSD